MFSGSRFASSGRAGRRLPVGLRQHDLPQHRLHAPALLHDSTASQSSSHRMRGAVTLARRSSPRCPTMPRPNNSCQRRFTATRAVSGCSGDTSQRGERQDESALPFSGGSAAAGVPAFTSSPLRRNSPRTCTCVWARCWKGHHARRARYRRQILRQCVEFRLQLAEFEIPSTCPLKPLAST
jgi:hypothetical protein